MAADGPVFNRHKSGSQSAQVVHFTSGVYTTKCASIWPELPAVMLEEQVVGSLWAPCRTHAPELLKSLCLYLNSTPGLLTLLGVRDNRASAYPSFSLDTMRDLQVPNLGGLTEDRSAMMDRSFDRFRKMPLMPFPQMADDEFRRKIDDAVAQAVGLDAEWIGRVRRELAREPAVTD